MADLLPPRQGGVCIETERSRALVFQRPVMLRGSVAYNAELPLWARSVPRKERRQRASHALTRFGIGHLAHRRAETLSGGELRRLALARAFVTEPGVLLLDEPFDDLDADGRQTLSFDLRQAIGETDVGVAMVTHDLRQALLLADRIAVLRSGRLVQVGSRDDVLRRPATPAVAESVGMGNLIPGVAISHDSAGLSLVELPSGQRLRTAMRVAPGEQLWVGIRPEHIKLEALRHTDTPSPWNGEVQRLVSDGSLVTAWIDWDGVELRTHLIAGRGLGHTLKPGDRILFAIRPEDVHLMPRP
jgi:ABC-type Fe3+/spermidine/putrescine transport system ATPase subunit